MLRSLLRKEDGATAMGFALTAAVVLGLAAGAISITSAAAEKTQIQDSLDAAALSGARMFVGNSPTQDTVKTVVGKFLTASNPRLGSTNITVNTTERSVLLHYSGDSNGGIATPIWNGVTHLSATSKAMLGAPSPYPVCILITEPTDSHTLRSGKNGFMDLNHCLVQVNTNNWDAVEAEQDGSYIHINDGENCFVGDIHFGDVKPVKKPTCNLFPDPFKKLTIPAHGCLQTKLVVKAATTLSPGGYCGGLKINASTTFQPGIYYIKDGPLEINGSSTNVIAKGVTFVLEGKNAGLTVNDAGKLVFSPASGAGDLDGFAFYQDPGASTDPLPVSYIKKAEVNVDGALYFSPSAFVLSSGTNMTVNNGSMVTGYLLSQGGTFVFNGVGTAATATQIALQKDVEKTSPVLVN